jgi:hypothetical protein
MQWSWSHHTGRGLTFYSPSIRNSPPHGRKIVGSCIAPGKKDLVWSRRVVLCRLTKSIAPGYLLEMPIPKVSPVLLSHKFWMRDPEI